MPSPKNQRSNTKSEYTKECFFVRLTGKDESGQFISDIRYFAVKAGDDVNEVAKFADNTKFKLMREEGWSYGYVFHAFQMNYNKDAGQLVDSEDFAPVPIAEPVG